MNVRLSWLDTSYGNYDVMEARLRELGVRYISDGFCATCEYQITRMKRLAAVGIRSNIGVSDLNAGSAAMQASLQVIRNRLLDSVVSVSAPNEPDISGDPLWVAHTRAYQAELYSRVKTDPALAHLLVLGSPLVNRESRPALGDLSALLDRGNIHPYPAGTMPMTHLDLERQLAAHVSGNKPLVATETGYHNDLSYLGIHRGASEAASADYTPRSVLEAFRQGVERTYIYQLIDPWSPTLAQQRNIPGWENAFGLLRWDLSRKPAFIALRNLLRAVDGDSEPVATPGGLRYGLEGAGPDVRQLLLRSADGSFALALWRQVSVWDRDALTALPVAPDQFDVVLGEPLALAQRFDPVASDAEVARWTDPQRIPVDVGGGPVVLRLTPPGIAPPAAVPRVTPKLGRTKRRQRLGKYVVVKTSCTAPCARLTAKGRLLVKRGKRQRSFKLKPARKAARGKLVVLRLKIPVKARRAAKRALKHGGRVRARVAVTARSASGAKLGTVRKTIVLTRKR